MLTSIDVTPIALLSMSLHCIQHSTDAVHGIVLGYTSTDSNNNDNNDNKYIITDVVPILHGTTITVPIIEIAYGLLTHIIQRLNNDNNVQNNNNNNNNNNSKIQILGWYTSPMLIPNNQSPNPLLLRIMSNLASAAAAVESSSDNTSLIVSDPILLVVQNETFTSYITGEWENSSSSSSSSSITQLFQIYTNNGSKGQNNAYIASKTSIIINVKQQQQVSNIKNSNNDVYMTLLSAITKAKDQKIRILDLMDYYTTMEDISASISSTTKGITNVSKSNNDISIQWFPNNTIKELLL